MAGRTEGVKVSESGREQVRRMASRMKRLAPAAIYSSPIERCRETAEILGEETGAPVEVRDVLAELDFGRWTGQKWANLREDDLWQRWDAHRSGTRMPGGETMLEVQGRIIREMLRIREERPGQRVAVVSHGDVIKSAVAHVLAVPLDLMLRIEISLASVSVVEWGERGPWVLGVNFTGEIEMPYAH
ncbi:MAG: histidine phosphatase family protein [Phycisphaerae bacterium]